jgi:hypothetical protein
MDAKHTSQEAGLMPPAPADPAESAVHAAIDTAVARYPELARLRAALDGDLSITPAYVAAARDPAIAYGRRSLLLRILIGDPSAGGPSAAHGLRGATLHRFLQWATLIGALEYGEGEREDIPKGFAALLGVSRTSFSNFVAQAFVRPWWDLQHGLRPSLPALSALGDDDLAPLKTAFMARRMTQQAAERLLGMDDRSPKAADWFFDTGCPALDLRNTLVFLGALFACHREGGRIQNRVPVALSTRWGLRRLSLPDAMAFADVAALAIGELLELDQVSDDWIGLRKALATQRDRSLVRGDAGDGDAIAALERHSMRWVLPAATAEQRLTALVCGTEAGTFDTGFMFNAARLVRRRPFEGFAVYYAAVTPEAVAVHASRRWGLPAGAVVAAAASLAPEAAPIAVRDLGNILSLLAAMSLTALMEPFHDRRNGATS